MSIQNHLTKRARIMQMVARVFGVFFSERKIAPIEPQNIKRIVWVRLDHIGDIVMSLPSLQMLREQFPDAQLDVVVRPGCRALFEDLKLQDRVLVYDTPRFPSRGRGAGIFRTLQFMRKLRRGNYDVSIEPRGDDIARLLCWSSGAPVRIGPSHIFYEAADAPNLRFLMTHTATPSPSLPLNKGKGDALAAPLHNSQNDQLSQALPSLHRGGCPVGRRPGMGSPSHAVLNNCAVLQPLLKHRVLEVPHFRFPIPNKRRTRVQTLLQQRGVASGFVVLHACSNDTERNWKTENWSQVAEYLTERNYDVVLTGIARDREINQEIRALSKQSERVHDFSGAIALPDLAAFFSCAQLLVTVDTGPMHIAAFSDTPIVALFLPHLAPHHAPFGQEDSVVLPPQINNEYSIADIKITNVIAMIGHKLEIR